jgi:phospholipid-translocating ATPase
LDFFCRYIVGQKDKYFNRKIFAECALHGMITSCVIFFFSYLCLDTSDVQSFGFMVATILVLVVNIQNALEMWYWTWIYIFILFLTVTLHFLLHLMVYSTVLRETFNYDYPYVGIGELVLTNPTFWFTCLLICVILILPAFGRE